MQAQREHIAKLYSERHLSKLIHQLNRDAIKRSIKIIRAVESGNVAREVYKQRALKALGL
jgi:hypothetical protein